MRIHKDQAGSAVIILLIILVLAAIGFGGYYVWHTQHTKTPLATTSKLAPTTKATTAPALTSTKLSLANSAVTFTVPASWTVTSQPTTTCLANATSDDGVVCEGAANVAPSNNPKPADADAFTASTKVYTADGATDAKTWFLDKFGGGLASSSDTTSTTAINGYSTYYYKQVTNSYIDVTYAMLKGDTVAVVYSRVSETHYAPGDGQVVDGHNDFTQNIPGVTSLANSVTIQ